VKEANNRMKKREKDREAKWPGEVVRKRSTNHYLTTDWQIGANYGLTTV